MTIKKAILRGLVGFPIGIFISVTITMFISLTLGTGDFYPVVPELIQKTNSEINAFVLQYILSGLLGVAFGIGSAVFEVESFSIAKQTAIHFCISVFAMLPVAYICHWMDTSIQGIIVYFLTFAFFYVVIWFIQYSVWKSRINQINDKLRNK